MRLSGDLMGLYCPARWGDALLLSFANISISHGLY